MADRQDLILYLASIHSAAVKSGRPLGFCRIPMRLMTLRDWVYDYRRVFDYFFSVASHGYNLGEKHEISVIIPKKLDTDHEAPRKLTYTPPPCPSEGSISKVHVHQDRAKSILALLVNTGRLDLSAPVEWLLTRPTTEVNFYFSRAGRLQLRDTSTWPIAAIETWPKWLREELFGGGIDIESAYTQFLFNHIHQVYADRPHFVSLLFPDLVKCLEDKQNWRRELCTDLLGLEWNDDGEAMVKKICMSLANGSKISPAILMGSSPHSVTRNIVIQKVPDVSPSNLNRIGERLAAIAKQYSAARKLVCTQQLKLEPTRSNQKQVFKSYFEWEREARYQIWEAIGRHGIMVHDGIDGVPERYLADLPGLVERLNIKLTSS